MSDVHVEIGTPNHAVSVIDTYIDPNQLIKESLFELFGTFTFITLSLGNIALAVLFPESGMNLSGIAIAWGLNIMFGVYIASFKAPGHLNPAVSFIMYLDNKINVKQLVLYTLAQLFGAFLAAVYVYSANYDKLTLRPDLEASSIFVTYKNSEISFWTAFNVEFTGTALLVGGILTFIDHVQTKKYLPVYIGAWFTALVSSFGFQTAFAWNPARDLGPRILSSIVGYDVFNYVDNYFWVPLIAPYCGAIFAYYFYIYVFKPNSS